MSGDQDLGIKTVANGFAGTPTAWPTGRTIRGRLEGIPARRPPRYWNIYCVLLLRTAYCARMRYLAHEASLRHSYCVVATRGRFLGPQTSRLLSDCSSCTQVAAPLIPRPCVRLGFRPKPAGARPTVSIRPTRRLQGTRHLSFMLPYFQYTVASRRPPCTGNRG